MNITIDTISLINIIGLLYCFFLAFLFLLKKSGNRRANIKLALFIFNCIVCCSFVVFYNTNLYWYIPHLLYVYRPALFLIGPLVFFYIKSLISPSEEQFKKTGLLHFLPCVLYTIYLTPEILRSGQTILDEVHNQHADWSFIIYILPIVLLQIIFYLIAIFLAIKQHEIKIKYTFSSIENINLAWVKRFIIVFGIICCIFIPVFFLVPLGVGFKDISNLLPVSVSFGIFLIGFYAWIQPNIFFESVRVSANGKGKSIKKSNLKIIDLIEKERLFTKPNLTLHELSRQLSIVPEELTNILKKHVKKSFYDFINGFRVEEAKNMLVMPESNHAEDLVATALAVGFESKLQFKKVFRSYTHMTPEQFRKKHTVAERKTVCTIGIFVDSFYDSYEATIFSGIEKYVKTHGVRIIYFNGGAINAPHYLYTKKNAVFDLAHNKNIDGLIMVTSSLGSYISRQEIVSFCNRYHDIPLVSIGMELKDHTSVIVDNYSGVYNLLVHLIEVHGFRRLAFICGPEKNVEAQIRFNAYKDVLMKYGIAFDENLVFAGTFFGYSGEKAIKAFINERKVGFDAVVATNDLVAIQVIQGLKNRGIRVPRDVAVVGFDNIKAGRTLPDPLTTISQPEFDLGCKAAEIMLALLSGQKIEKKIELPTELIIRASCGCVYSHEAEENNETILRKTYYYQMDPDGITKQPLLKSKEREFEFFLISQSLLTILEISSLKKIVAASFPKIGIRSCYISIFKKDKQNRQTNFSKIILGFKDYKIIDYHPEEQVFLTKDLLPGGIKNVSFNRFLIIMTLFFKNEQLGFVIYESENTENEIFEILTIQLSNALKGVMLYGNLKEQVDTLSFDTKKDIDLTEKYKKLKLSKEKSEEYFRKLLEHMDKEEIFKDPDLSLPELAEELNIPRNHLSYVINEYAGLNFYDFINSYRVEEAKRILLKPTYQKENILNIAFDAGFKSKSTFNKIFKKHTNQTPKEFRKKYIIEENV
ncbi:MAG: helix-turn-helix domain-containing protein [Spirochaetales bacterium]|nr:helix-turn-helix domain-containing protein [Spirochaetales bacterium]